MSLLLMAAVLAASGPPMPDGPALRASIEARDAEFFQLFFEGCDPARLRLMLADDVEFYHDKGGFAFRNAEAMVADYDKQCAERAKPDSWRSRRELVKSSLIVDPVPGYGAMEAGDHLFYERKGEGPEKLAGKARFTMVWVWDGGTWKLSRVLSYDHKPAEQQELPARYADMPSTVIKRFDYLPERQELVILFTTGRRYLYFDVPEEAVRQLRSAYSKGAHFNRHIRDRYSYHEISESSVLSTNSS